MISVPARRGETAGCHPHTEGEDEPAVVLFIRCGKEALWVHLNAMEAKQLAASLSQDAVFIGPALRHWRAQNDSLTEEDILSPDDADE